MVHVIYKQFNLNHMAFIKVNATACNPQGNTQGGHQTILFINPAHVAAVTNERRVKFIGGPVINLGGDFYTNITVHLDVDMNTL